MGFWSKLGKGLAIGGAGLGTALSFGAAAPALGAALGGLGLTGATGGAIASGLGAAGAGLGAMSQGQASNRGEKFGGQMDLEQLLMQRDQQQFNNTISREQEGRASGQDAWRRLLAAQHTLNPGARPQLSPYSVAPRQAGAAELSGADAMTQEVLARLQGGNPIPQFTQRPMNIDPKLLDAGAWERIAGYLSPALSVAGQFGQRPTQMSGVPRGGNYA